MSTIRTDPSKPSMLLPDVDGAFDLSRTRWQRLGSIVDRPTDIQIVSELRSVAAVPAFIDVLLDGLAAAKTGVALFDSDDRCVFGSQAFIDFLDVQPGEQTYASMMRHCHRSGRGIAIFNPDVEAWIRAALIKRRSLPFRTIEKDLFDGRWLRITETTFNGGWVLNILCDISDLKSHEMTLREARDAALVAAETDALTGLLNRSALQTRFDDAVRDAHGTRQPLSVSLVDLDHFKQINDTFGHDAGDRVLIDFGNLGRATLRKGDVPGRVGGEEFFFLMPATKGSDAVEVMQCLQHRVEMSRPSDNPALCYTMSAGVTTLGDSETSADLYSRADRLLYRAKAAGRNQIAFL